MSDSKISANIRVLLILSIFVPAVIIMGDKSVNAAGYAFTDLGGLVGSNSYATDINNNGRIIGTFTNESGTHGFVTDGYSVTPFDVPGAVTFTVNGINDAGRIVGDYSNGSGTYGYVKDGDVFTSFQYPVESPYGTDDTRATGINNNGQIVGSYSSFYLDEFGGTYAGIRNGYVLDGSTFTSFRHPDLQPTVGFTYTFDMNDNGQIVGRYDDDITDVFPGYVKEGDTYTTFWTLPGISDMNIPPSMYPHGINDNGQITGYYNATSHAWQGFVKEGDAFSPLVYPGALWTMAYGINDNGQIVGAFYDGGTYRGFLATPVPAPAAVLLFGSGLAGLVGFRRSLMK